MRTGPREALHQPPGSLMELGKVWGPSTWDHSSSPSLSVSSSGETCPYRKPRANTNTGFSLKARTSRQSPQIQWGVGSLLFYIASICPFFSQTYCVKNRDGGFIQETSDTGTLLSCYVHPGLHIYTYTHTRQHLHHIQS